SAAPEGAAAEFVTKRLISYGLVRAPSAALATRIGWASEWAKRTDGVAAPLSAGDSRRVVGGGENEEGGLELDEKTAAALREFARLLPVAGTADDVQGSAFAALRDQGLEPARFFQAV